MSELQVELAGPRDRTRMLRQIQRTPRRDRRIAPTQPAAPSQYSTLPVKVEIAAIATVAKGLRAREAHLSKAPVVHVVDIAEQRA